MPIKKLNTLFAQNTLQSKIAKGIAWSFLGTMISKVMMILIFVIVARIVTVEQYGEIGILRNAILTFSMIALASFGITATRYIAIYLEKDLEKTNKILTLTRISVLILSILITFFMYFFSYEISKFILNNENLEEYVKYISFAILFTSLNGYQNGALAGLEKFKEISYINIINGICSFPIIIVGALYWEVQGVIIGLVISNFILWLSSYYYLNKALRDSNIKLDFNFKEEFKILLKFSLPTFISGLMLTPTFFIINSMLAHRENGYIQLGIFSAAFFFANLSKTLIQILGQVLYPYAMKEFGKNNKQFEYINNILPWITGILVNLPLIIFPEIFSLLFGEKYMNGDFYLSLIFIALSNIILSYGQGIGRNLAAANLMWWSVFSNTLWSMITIIVCYLTISWGSVALSFSIFIGYLINFILFIPFYLRNNIVKKDFFLCVNIQLLWLFTFISTFTYFIEHLIIKCLIFSILILIFIKNITNIYTKAKGLK